jgi:hypothetical protein
MAHEGLGATGRHLAAIQENLRRVLHGEKPKRLDQPEVPLQIAASVAHVVEDDSTDN